MTNTSTRPTLKQVQQDYRVLDATDFEVPANVKILTNIPHLAVEEVQAEYIKPNAFVRFFQKCSALYHFFYAIQIVLWGGVTQHVFVIDGGSATWFFAGYINRLFVRQRRVMILSDCFLEYHLGKERRFCFFPFLKFKTQWKIALARGALLGYEAMLLWSQKQIAPHAKMFNLPEERFCFIPFKSNQSKTWQLHCDEQDSATYNLPLGGFIFSGGNSKRDYPCLIEAVRNTEIPVIISATDPQVRNGLERLPNVILLGAPEPAYSQLMAASQFSVVPVIYSGVKGCAEAFFCDTMWCSKAIIACDSIAADDYIIDGKTGYVVPAGDSEGLRKRILELWNDPVKCEEMGRKGRERCEQLFTHEHWVRRHLRLALLVFEEYNERKGKVE